MRPAATPLTKKDFISNQPVRWCPGCGDYAILSQIQSILPTLGIPQENFVFVSGIGCSSRLPYYMNTFGFHSIHGRAAAIATGVKMMGPDLQVWVATGDGDALSIGGNHFLHTLRRNVDLRIILFNNAIYGLTKGQFSPTSPHGLKTKSTPDGVIDRPMNPTSVAIGAEATFVGRALAADPRHLGQVLERAAHHRGTAFVEVIQNCLIFNDDCFDYLEDKTRRPENALYLEHGKALRFGRDLEKAIRLDNTKPVIVPYIEGDETLLRHDESIDEPTYAYMLSRLRNPEFPVPLGVFRAVERPTFDALVRSHVESKRQNVKGSLRDYFLRGGTWTIE